MNKEQYYENRDTFIKPLKAIDREEKQLTEAGYVVERKELIDGSSKYIEVFNPKEDVFSDHQRRVVFLYDGTGNVLNRLLVLMTPYELNHDKETQIF